MWSQPKCPLIDKENVIYLYKRIQFSLKKKKRKENPAICNNRDKPGKHAKWNRSDTEENTTLYQLYEKSKIFRLIKAKNRVVVARSWEEEETGEVLVEGYKVSVI